MLFCWRPWKNVLLLLLASGAYSYPLELLCRFCGKIVVDDDGNKTDDFGLAQRGTYVCARCAKALEFALGD